MGTVAHQFKQGGEELHPCLTEVNHQCLGKMQHCRIIITDNCHRVVVVPAEKQGCAPYIPWFEYLNLENLPLLIHTLDGDLPRYHHIERGTHLSLQIEHLALGVRAELCPAFPEKGGEHFHIKTLKQPKIFN